MNKISRGFHFPVGASFTFRLDLISWLRRLTKNQTIRFFFMRNPDLCLSLILLFFSKCFNFIVPFFAIIYWNTITFQYSFHLPRVTVQRVLILSVINFVCIWAASLADQRLKTYYLRKLVNLKIGWRQNLMLSLLSAAGLFNYVWPFSGHQALKG